MTNKPKAVKAKPKAVKAKPKAVKTKLDPTIDAIWFPALMNRFFLSIIPTDAHLCANEEYSHIKNQVIEYDVEITPNEKILTIIIERDAASRMDILLDRLLYRYNIDNLNSNIYVIIQQLDRVGGAISETIYKDISLISLKYGQDYAAADISKMELKLEFKKIVKGTIND